MKHLSKVLFVAFIAMSVFSCKKNQTIEKEQLRPFSNKETISKMVSITKQQTAILKQKINELNASNTRMTNHEYNNFVRDNIELYSEALIESEPNYIENDSFQINQIDDENWDGESNVYTDRKSVV